MDPDIGLRVMATEENDCRTFFSNFSPSTNPTLFNIAAPGWEIPSTLPEERFGPLSGTSMASPIVAGASALVWGQFPSLTRDQVIARLINNGQAITCGFAAPPGAWTCGGPSCRTRRPWSSDECSTAPPPSRRPRPRQAPRFRCATARRCWAPALKDRGGWYTSPSALRSPVPAGTSSSRG